MNKFLTLALTAAFSASAFSAAAQIKLPEAQKRIEEGRALKYSTHKIMPGSPLQGIPVMRVSSENSFTDNILETRELSNPLIQEKAPSRITDAGSLIYGFATASGDQVTDPKGLYEISSATVRMIWRDQAYSKIGYNIQTGFTLDGKLMGTGIEAFGGYLFSYASFVYDISTGELDNITEYPDFRDDESIVIYEIMSYNPTDGNVYGICQARDGNYHWYSTTPDALGTGNDLGETSRDIVGMCWSPAENSFVGISEKGYLVKIDLDGSYENMFQIEGDFNFGYYSGITYSPVEKVYYVNLRDDQRAYLATVDPETHKTTTLYPTPSDLHFSILYCDDVADVDPLMPKAPTLKSIDFPDGSTSGTITYVMPTETEDGTALEGELRAFASVGSVNVGPEDGFAATPGQELTVEFTDVPEGFNMFRLYVKHNDLRSQSSNETIYVGNDTPKSPARVTITTEKISWPRVTQGVHGGYVARDEVSYEVYVNGELIGETDKLSYEYPLPSDVEYQLYTASVIAVCRGYKSEPTYSRDIAYGKPFDLPYLVIPTDEQAELITIGNNDSDGSYWWHNDVRGGMLSGYTDDRPGLTGIDWMFMPPVNIDSLDKFYTLSFDLNMLAEGAGALNIEVWCGSEPTEEAMQTQILAATAPTAVSPEFGYNAMLFQPGFTGPCYIGFRAYTKESNQNSMCVRMISIEDHNTTLASPQQPFNVSAVPAEQGVLEATVSFNMPRRTLSEETISSDTEITAYAWVDTDRQVSVTGKPGERVSVVVPTSQGDNHIYVMASIDGNGSMPARIDAYTGVVAPETPVFKRSTVAPDMQSMTIEWEPVTTGVNGGYIVPEDVTYDLYNNVINFFGMSSWEKIAELGHVTEHTYTCPEGMQMQFMRLGIGSSNAAGTNGKLFGVQALLGTPYTLPAVENFNNGFQLLPWYTENPGPEYADNSFSLIPLNQVFDDINSRNDNALTGTGAVGTKGYLNAPRFSTTGVTEGSVRIYLYTGPGAAPVKVYARIYGQSAAEIGSVTPDRDGYKFEEFIFDLPAEYLGQMWVQISFEPQYENGGQTFLLNAFEASNVSGVNAVESGASIYAGKGCVNVINHKGENVTICNAAGIVIANISADSDNCAYPLDKGVYVVKAGRQNAKIIVR